MKNKAKLFGIYLPALILITVATAVIRTVALFTSFNYETGYFTEKVLPRVSDYILIAGVIFFFTYIFTSKRNMKLIPDFTSPATYIPTGVVSAALIFMVFSLFSRSSRILDVIKKIRIYKIPSEIEQIPSLTLLFAIVVLTAVFATLSIMHFALTALVDTRSSTKRANFGICTVIFLALYSLYLYFSTDLPINAPNKALDQMAYLFAAVFFLYETRLSFGREKWRHYIAFGFIASSLCAYSSVPSIIYYFVEGRIVSNSIYESALTFALFIFITSRLLLTAALIENVPSDTALALINSATARDEKVNAIPEPTDVIDIEGESLEPAAEVEDGNQMSIDDMEMGIDINSDKPLENDESADCDTESAELENAGEREESCPSENNL